MSKRQKTITMAVNGRPDYLKRVLLYLSRCININKYLLIVGLEPGSDICRDILQKIRFCQTHLISNQHKLGCPTNTYQVLKFAFIESEYNIHLEDDILLHEDSLLYFEHCQKTFHDDPKIFTVSAYNYQECGPSYYHAYGLRPTLTSWGWATWRDRFEEMQRAWRFDYSEGGWDENMDHHVRSDRLEVYPVLSRAQNIGARGAHVPSEAWHAMFQYNDFWAGKVKPPRNKPFTLASDWQWKERPIPEEAFTTFPAAWIPARHSGTIS